MSDLFEPVRRARATIVNAKGLHARAAAKLAKLAVRFKAEITIARNDMTVSARSIMGLMMLAAGKGAEIEITARGPDAEAALAAVVVLVQGGFGER
ncbi:MAG TPA: HPr family phosphocarrier protein [Alphaproteobacteria bacterium]